MNSNMWRKFMVKRNSLFISLLLIFFVAACSNSNEVLLSEYSVGNVTKTEFEKKYAQSVGGIENAVADSIQDYENYLKLYTDYKLKLRNAHIRGYDESPAIITEFNDYVNQIGENYIIEKKILEPRLKEIYEQAKEEIRISHILIRTDNKPDAAAKSRAEMVLDKIKNGENFNTLAKEYSEHAQTKNTGGDLYYFTVNQILRPIEKAMYQTKIGEVYPEPVKTAYGYHIIKVTDRQPRKYKVKASHILVKFIVDANGKVDTVATKTKVDSIALKLTNGEDFAELAKKYSDDKGSAVKGGNLNYFERRRMVLPFDSVAFSLPVGEISEPVLTNFGYHIIKVTDIQNILPFDRMVDKLKERYKKTGFDTDKADFINGLGKKFNLNVNTDLVNTVAKKLVRTKFGDDLTENPKYKVYKDSVLISTNDKKVTVENILETAKNLNDLKNKEISQTDLAKLVDNKKNSILFISEAHQMLKDDSEFRDLMDEFRNGLLIYKMQEEEIWNKLKIDSLALKNLFEEKKNELLTKEMVTYQRISSQNDSLVALTYRNLVDGKSVAELVDEINSNPKSELEYAQATDETEGNYLANEVKNNKIGKPSSPFQYGKSWHILILDEYIPARLETYEEALPELQSIYQEMESKRLSDEFTQKLHEIYNVEFYFDNLNNLYK